MHYWTEQSSILTKALSLGQFIKLSAYDRAVGMILCAV